MAGASTIKPCWTSVRTQGNERAALPYERPAPEASGIAGRRGSSLLEHQCPGCAGALKDNDELVALVIGPGTDAEARAAQRRGEWFDAIAVVCHAPCVADVRRAALSPAMKVAAASAMIREAALQVSERVQAHGVSGRFDPSIPLMTIVGATERASKDLSGWEEQLT